MVGRQAPRRRNDFSTRAVTPDAPPRDCYSGLLWSTRSRLTQGESGARPQTPHAQGRHSVHKRPSTMYRLRPDTNTMITDRPTGQRAKITARSPNVYKHGNCGGRVEELRHGSNYIYLYIGHRCSPKNRLKRGPFRERSRRARGTPKIRGRRFTYTYRQLLTT